MFLCYILSDMLRRLAFGSLIVLSALMPVRAFGAFVGPTQAPPDGNVPGVIWNKPAADINQAQAGADYNISGSGRLGGDVYLGNAKALRIDAQGSTSLNIGNWGNGTFVLNVIGDIQTDASDGAEGKMTAQKFCLGASCITAWPNGGGGGSSDYVLKSGDVMSGFLTLNADPNDSLQAATKHYVDTSVANAGGGDITGVTAGTGLQGGAQTGNATLQLDASHQDGSAYDDRFVNISGDIMTGNLDVPNLRMSNALLGTVQGYPWQLAADRSLLELTNTSNGKLQLMREGNKDYIYANAAGAQLPISMFSFVRSDGLQLVGLTSNAVLRVSEKQSVPVGYTQHTAVDLGSAGGGTNHVGVDSNAYTSNAYAGRFVSTYGGTSKTAVLGTPSNAAEFTGSVCINNDCRASWPTSSGGSVTNVGSGTGLVGGPITNSGTLGLDVSYTDNRYVNVTGDALSGDLTSSAAITANKTISGGTSGSNTYGFLSVNPGGNTYGLYTSASAYGVYGIGGTSGAVFSNSASPYTTYVAYNGYGVYAAVPTVNDFGFYTNGKLFTTGSATIMGDVIASNNVLSSCTWTAYVADGTALTCPSTTPLMSGMQRSGTTMRIYCCAL